MSSIFQKPPNNYLYSVGLHNLVFTDRSAGPHGGGFVNFVVSTVTLAPNTFAQLHQKLLVAFKGKVNSLGAITLELVLDGVVMASISVGSSGGANRIYNLNSEITLETPTLLTLLSTGRTNVIFAAGVTAIGDSYGYNEVAAFDPTIAHTLLYRFNGGAPTDSVFDMETHMSII